MKLKMGVYPEEKNITKYISAPNLNIRIEFAWRLAAYIRDVVGKQCSGFARRTTAEQQALYDAWKAGKGNEAAAPGTSWHEFGFAFDFNRIATSGGIGIYPGTINADFDLWRAGKAETLNKYGLCHAVASERHHIVPVETIGYSGNRADFCDPDDYYVDDYKEEELIMKKGDKGDAVKTWQEMILFCGYKMINDKGVVCTADGDFGSGTVNGTNLFKADEGLSRDGIVDNITATRMMLRIQKMLSESDSEKIGELQYQIDELKKSAQEDDEQYRKLKVYTDGIESEIAKRDKQISGLNAAIESDKVAINSITSELDKSVLNITELESKLETITKQLSEKKSISECTPGELLSELLGRLSAFFKSSQKAEVPEDRKEITNDEKNA